MTEEHEETSYTLRIGSLVLHNVGQLLPHQLQSAVFHNRNFIYPVCFNFSFLNKSIENFCKFRSAIRSHVFIGQCVVQIVVVLIIVQ